MRVPKNRGGIGYWDDSLKSRWIGFIKKWKSNSTISLVNLKFKKTLYLI